MKSLLIVSHGSRVQAANDEVVTLVKEIGKISENSFYSVKHAFLEIANPATMEQINALVQAGCREIVIFPYFLAVGRHVRDDLPQIVQQARKQYPEVLFTLTRHLGGISTIKELILDAVSRGE